MCFSSLLPCDNLGGSPIFRQSSDELPGDGFSAAPGSLSLFLVSWKNLDGCFTMWLKSEWFDCAALWAIWSPCGGLPY